jgi:SRSO17 transposase
MTPKQILSLGPELADFLDQFSDCFGRCEPRNHLSDYVRGQLSDLPRKSVEPIALFVGVAPRTLQEFLSSDEWDHDKLRDRTQQIVASQHADPEAIGIIDDSGHPKKGEKTACVHRQYCGNTGKIDNCVVTVHLSYASYDTSFRTTLDTTVYLPEEWSDDRDRCREAGIPDEVVYRAKHVIALEQLDRALANGVIFAWICADEWYAEKPAFLAGLEQREQRYVVEIPRNLMGWLYHPGAKPDRPGRPVDHLAQFSRPMIGQEWIRFHIKDTEKGPMVWEIKATAQFWLRRDGQILGPYWLIHARNVLDLNEEKYFLSNASPKTPL